MSHRSKRLAPPDSLDLLLDTMCNAFGGIVIIAILVALMINSSNKGPVSTPEDARLAQEINENIGKVKEEIQGVEIEMEANEEKLDRLGKADLAGLLEDQKETADALAEVEKEADRLEAEKRALDGKDPQEVSEELDAKLAERLAEAKAAEARKDAAEEDRARTASEIQEAEEELAELEGEDDREMRRPGRQEMTDLEPYNLIFKFGKVYRIAILRFDTGGIRLNTDDIDWIGDSTALPRRDKGLDMGDPADRKILSEYLQNLAAYEETTYELQCQVFEDSFAGFDRFLRGIHGKLDPSIRLGWKPTLGDEVISYGSEGTKAATGK